MVSLEREASQGAVACCLLPGCFFCFGMVRGNWLAMTQIEEPLGEKEAWKLDDIGGGS